MVWAAKEHFDELSDVQVFVPGATFEPTHYGSVIAVRPTDKPVIVLTGDDSSGGLRPGKTAADWTRGMSRDPDGRSRARPLWDGSLANSFPSGPLHLDSPVAGTRGNDRRERRGAVPVRGVRFRHHRASSAGRDREDRPRAQPRRHRLLRQR